MAMRDVQGPTRWCSKGTPLRRLVLLVPLLVVTAALNATSVCGNVKDGNSNVHQASSGRAGDSGYSLQVQSNLHGRQPWVDVTAYGAKGDGSTDDTAAIRAAINAACNSSTGGGAVFFPPSTATGYYRVSQPQGSNAPIFATPCPGLHFLGGNSLGGWAGQFSRAPLTRIEAHAGSNPGLGPVFLVNKVGVTIENLSITGYNQAVQVNAVVQFTMHNFWLGVSDTNQPVGPSTATDNCALCLYNSFWIVADQGAITVQNSVRDWAIVMAQISGTNQNNAGLYHFNDIVETGPNLYDIRTNVTAAAGTIEFNWVQTESVNGPWLTLMQNGGGGGVDYPGPSLRFVNLFDCSGLQPLIALKANVKMYQPAFYGSSSNCSGAGPLLQVFNATYPSAKIDETGGAWPIQAVEDESGNVLAPFMMGNVNGTDYVADTGNAVRLRTDYQTSDASPGATGALGTPIRMIQKGKTQANLGIDPAAGVLFGDATNPGYSAALNQTTMGTLDVQIAKVMPPTHVRAMGGSGGSCARGTYYYKVVSALIGALESYPSMEVSSRVATNGTTVLSWTPALGAGVNGYIVYRSTRAAFFGTQPYYIVSGRSTSSFRDTCASPSGNGAPPVAGISFGSAARISAGGVASLGSCTNSELTLSSGWGSTANVSGAVGLGQTCEWTITSKGTGQAANPTITDALTNALPSANTVCDMRMVGGTGAATLIDQTTLSATAPVFTFNGTPGAGSKYKVVRRCGP